MYLNFVIFSVILSFPNYNIENGIKYFLVLVIKN